MKTLIGILLISCAFAAGHRSARTCGPVQIEAVAGEHYSLTLTDACHARITLPRLEEVEAHRGARVALRGFSGPHLRMKLDGAARLEADGVFSSFELSASNRSRADLESLGARMAYVRVDESSRAALGAIDQLHGYR